MNNQLSTCLLSTAYWGNIQYFTKFILYKNVIIEQYETYPKQSYRNRCNIYGVNGVQTLNVPIKKGTTKNVLVKDLQISYDMPWQNNHFKTIESAYRSSPFFEYLLDDIIPIYNTKYKYLLDLNRQIFEVCCEWLSIDNKDVKLSDDFELKPSCDDYRNTIHPKASKNAEDKYFCQEQYIQGFEQRNGFISNLSILDLIVNTGSEARNILFKSIK